MMTVRRDGALKKSHQLFVFLQSDSPSRPVSGLFFFCGGVSLGILWVCQLTDRKEKVTYSRTVRRANLTLECEGGMCAVGQWNATGFHRGKQNKHNLPFASPEQVRCIILCLKRQNRHLFRVIS